MGERVERSLTWPKVYAYYLSGTISKICKVVMLAIFHLVTILDTEFGGLVSTNFISNFGQSCLKLVGLLTNKGEVKLRYS